jgi:glucose-6-phosphate 1-dehydrogenase
MIERMVLFGASGDLTSRLLMPAIAQLAEAELLPPGLTIVGSDITDWSTGDFRQHIAGKLDEHASVAPATRDAVVSSAQLPARECHRARQCQGADR